MIWKICLLFLLYVSVHVSVVQRRAQSRSCHMPADGLKTEVVFAQLILSPCQDMHTAVNIYMPSVIHLQRDLTSIHQHKWTPHKHILSMHRIVHVAARSLYWKEIKKNLSEWILNFTAAITITALNSLFFISWHRYRSVLMDWPVTFSLMRKVAEPTILLVSWNWLPLDPRR